MIMQKDDQYFAVAMTDNLLSVQKRKIEQLESIRKIPVDLKHTAMLVPVFDVFFC